MTTRREFLRLMALMAAAPATLSAREQEIWLNDIHSQLNRTRARKLLRPRTEEELVNAVRSATSEGAAVCVSGSRHSMGGQQFLTNGICIDTRSLARIRRFDQERGVIE